MLRKSLGASSAGCSVGHDDPSHFSRDYKRLFGESQARDAERLRAMVVADRTCRFQYFLNKTDRVKEMADFFCRLEAVRDKAYVRGQ